MTQPAIAGVSAGHAFLEGLSERHLGLLVPAAKSFRAAPGEYLVHEGQPADAFYLVQSGRVAIGSWIGERGDRSILTVGAGDVVGWSWLLPPHLWQFDARAVEPVGGLRFDAAWLREQCEEDHDLGYYLLKKLLAAVSSRLAACRIQLLDIYK
jgi:CRP-like cAMP-binding protein